MQHTVKNKEFKTLTAAYFTDKAARAIGKEKFLIALEKSQYISAALQNGLSFADLRKSGFEFATV